MKSFIFFKRSGKNMTVITLHIFVSIQRSRMDDAINNDSYFAQFGTMNIRRRSYAFSTVFSINTDNTNVNITPVKL